MSNSLWPHGPYSSWNSPGQNTGVGSRSLLQGIFPTQGLNPDLSHCRWILYQLSHKGSPRILVWVAYPFSSRSSQPRNRTGVSCFAGFLTNRAIREFPCSSWHLFNCPLRLSFQMFLSLHSPLPHHLSLSADAQLHHPLTGITNEISPEGNPTCTLGDGAMLKPWN